MTIEDKYLEKCSDPACADISENLCHLKDYASKYEVIVEMGVRNIVSTWALLAGKPLKLTSIDIVPPVEYGSNIEEVYQMSKTEGINFEFVLGNTLLIEIEECDMLFIDTYHTYEHLQRELELHAPKVKHCLAFHDTVSFPGVYQAVLEFVEEHKEWSVDLHKENNNGMTFLIKHQQNK